MSRILVITPYYRPAYIYGGPARSVPTLCEGLSRAGAEVTVFTTNANGHLNLDVPTSRPTEVDGVEVWYFPRTCASLAPHFYYSPGLARGCDEAMSRFDAVYFNSTWTYPMLAGARSANKSGVPYMVSPRGCFMRWSMSQKQWKKRIYLSLFERRVIDRAAGIHCTSLLEAEQTKDWGFSPPTVIVPNPVHWFPSANQAAVGSFRESLGIPDNGTLSIFVGRKHPMKRLDLMIEAFARVTSHLDTAHLAIIGPDYGVEADLKRLIHQLGVASQVHLVEFLESEALASAYLAADVLVMLSQRENFGMAAAEALQFGIPVLLSEDVGLAAEVKAAGAGEVVHPNIDEIQRAWLDMLTQGKLGEMGIKGKRFAEQRLSSESVAKQMLSALQGLARKPLCNPA